MYVMYLDVESKREKKKKIKSFVCTSCTSVWRVKNSILTLRHSCIMHEHTHTHSLSLTHTHTYTHKQTLSHTHTHIHTLARARTHIHVHVHVYTHTHVFQMSCATLMHVHTHTHTHTYTHTHTHTYIRTHTHAHLHKKKLYLKWVVPRLCYMSHVSLLDDRFTCRLIYMRDVTHLHMRHDSCKTWLIRAWLRLFCRCVQGSFADTQVSFYMYMNHAHMWISHVTHVNECRVAWIIFDLNDVLNEFRDKDRKNEKICKKTTSSWEKSEEEESLWSFFHVDVPMIVIGLIHQWDMTHWHVRHDSLIRVTHVDESSFRYTWILSHMRMNHVQQYQPHTRQ